MLLISGICWIAMGIFILVKPKTHLSSDFVDGSAIMVSGISICYLATIGPISSCDDRAKYLMFTYLLRDFIILESKVDNDLYLPDEQLLIIIEANKYLMAINGLYWIAMGLYFQFEPAVEKLSLWENMVFVVVGCLICLSALMFFYIKCNEMLTYLMFICITGIVILVQPLVGITICFHHLPWGPPLIVLTILEFPGVVCCRIMRERLKMRSHPPNDVVE
nr:hypothetical transcript [Hymenolepis microstoma]